MSHRFAVIGIGRFGSRIAIQLARAGAEVIAIDRNADRIDDIADKTTVAVAMDGTDADALKAQGVDKVDAVLITMGGDFEANALTTAVAKGLGIKRVISRATNAIQAKILLRIGADAVVNPEDESADRWTRQLLAPYLVDHIELAEGYGIVQMKTPPGWVDQTLADLDVRRKHRVNVVAIKRYVATATSTGAESQDARVIDLPLPSTRLGREDVLVIAGHDEDLEALPE